MSVDTPVFDGNCLFLKMFEWSEIRSDLKENVMLRQLTLIMLMFKYYTLT